MSKISIFHLESLARFDALPDSAFVRLPVVMGLLSVSRATVWRWVLCGKIPAPKKMGRVTSWRVEELRKMLKKLDGV